MRKFTLFITTAMMLMMTVPYVQAQSARQKPNIIFIHADDLGYGDLSCYGQQKFRTPHIDRMAAEGVRLTQYYAGSTVCAPSRSVLMTGQHTGHTFIRGNGKENLRPGDVTVAEVLKSAGYETALIGKWGLGHEGSTGLPTKKGFDYFFGYLDQSHAHNYYPSFLVRNEQRVKLQNVVPDEGQYGQGVASSRVEYSHDLLTQEALAWIARRREQPFFLYLAYTIPHANNEAREKGMEVPGYGDFGTKDWPEPEKGFAAMMTRLDRDTGQLFERLRALGIDDKTIVFFTSDNGPHREGGHDPDFFDSNGRLRGIKRDLYEGGIRVPMIVRWPGRIKAGSVSHNIHAHQDFLPTAAELAGAAAPQKIDGISMLAGLTGGKQKQHEYLYWEFHERSFSQALRMGDWKAVRRGLEAPLELYNLRDDLSEQNNVAASQTGMIRKMEAIMRDARTESERWKPKASLQ